MMTVWWVVLILVVVLAWTLLRDRDRGGAPTPGGDRAESVLRERYARGEIDEEAYRRMLDELRVSRRG